MKGMYRIALALALLVGLAACSGGDRVDGLNKAAEQELQDQLDAANMTLAEVRAALAALQASGRAEDAARITALEERLQALEDAAAEEEAAAERKAMAATGKAMYAALGGAAADTNALANVTASTLGSAGLGLTVADDAGTLTGTVTVPTLKAGDSAGALGSWNGTNYGHTDTETKVENAAVVYNNKGPGRSQSFADAGITIATTSAGTVPNFTAIKGYVSVAGGDVVTPVYARVMADAFTHSGTQTHATNSDTGIFTTRGTYAGAPGVYRCTGACSSTNDNKGSPTALGGVWHFKPDAGANAMTHTPDANYLYYGWWVSKDKDGDPTAASAFTGVVGTIDPLPAGSDPGADLSGTATYAGHAAGKFALDYSKSKLIDGTSDGGHFTADVELTAKFGASTAANANGVSGTIDNFMANGESVDWSVALHRAHWGTNGAFATPTTDNADTTADETMGTTWSIGGTASDRSGTWSGQMYDEMPGNPPTGDGSNVPTTATGTFYSEYGAGTSTVGRMVGAFGASKQ